MVEKLRVDIPLILPAVRDAAIESRREALGRRGLLRAPQAEQPLNLIVPQLRCWASAL